MKLCSFEKRLSGHGDAQWLNKYELNRVGKDDEMDDELDASSVTFGIAIWSAAVLLPSAFF